MILPFHKNPNVTWSLVFCILALSFILLAWQRMLTDGITGDEGFYLLCGHLTADGQKPYADFGFTQPPAFLWLCARMLPLLDWSVSGIRTLNVILICLSLTFASLHLYQSKGPLAALLVWILAIASPGWIDASVLGKPHALGGLILTMASIVVLSTHRIAVRWGLFLLLASFGCLTRFTLAPYFAICFLLLLVETPTWKWRSAAIIVFILSAASIIYSIHGGNWEGFYFWTIDYHMLRVLPPKGDGRIPAYMHMLDGWRHAPMVWIALILSLLIRRTDRKTRVASLGLVITALSVVSTERSYGDYATPFVPAAIFLLATIVGPKFDDFRHIRLWPVLFPICMVIVVWFGWSNRPVLSVHPDRNYLKCVAETAAFVKQHLIQGSQVVSSVPEIPVEARLRMPLKLSMGRFSLSETIDQQRADRIGVCTPIDFFQFLKDRDTKAFIGSTQAFNNFAFSIPEIYYTSEYFISQFQILLETQYSLCHVNSHYVVFLRKPSNPAGDNTEE